MWMPKSRNICRDENGITHEIRPPDSRNIASSSSHMTQCSPSSTIIQGFWLWIYKTPYSPWNKGKTPTSPCCTMQKWTKTVRNEFPLHWERLDEFPRVLVENGWMRCQKWACWITPFEFRNDRDEQGSVSMLEFGEHDTLRWWQGR